MQVWTKIFGRSKKDEHSASLTFGTMLVAAIAGLIASLDLAIEKYHLLQNPDAVLSCSINLVLNCGVVMQTWQAEVFGFPNPIIGVVLYPAAISLAVFGLSKVEIPRWILLTANVIAALGALFAYWLFFQSVYVIQVLCPWCLVVTFVTTLIIAAITHYNLRQNTFEFNKKTHKKIREFIDGGYGVVVVVAWVVLLIGLVIVKFGESLLG